MSESKRNEYKDLNTVSTGFARLSGPRREQRVTVHHTTVSNRGKTVRGVLLVALLAVATGCGAKKGNSYAKATRQQEKCCELKQGDERTACLQKIIRVDDPAVASSSINQQTYACVESHFVCDGTTGQATKESAQKQLECIEDIGK